MHTTTYVYNDFNYYIIIIVILSCIVCVTVLTSLFTLGMASWPPPSTLKMYTSKSVITEILDNITMVINCNRHGYIRTTMINDNYYHIAQL